MNVESAKMIVDAIEFMTLIISISGLGIAAALWFGK